MNGWYGTAICVFADHYDVVESLHGVMLSVWILLSVYEPQLPEATPTSPAQHPHNPHNLKQQTSPHPPKAPLSTMYLSKALQFFFLSFLASAIAAPVAKPLDGAALGQAYEVQPAHSPHIYCIIYVLFRQSTKLLVKSLRRRLLPPSLRLTENTFRNLCPLLRVGRWMDGSAK